MNYDLTGTLYSRSALFGRISATISQVLELKEPAFSDSLLVVDVATGSTLVLNTHYRLNTTDYDNAALSDAIVLANGALMTKTFVKSITLVPGGTSHQQIRVSWKALYQNYLNVPLEVPNGPEALTPAQIKFLFDELNYLRTQQSISQMNNVSALAAIKVLDVDTRATSTDNYITNESHSVNVNGGRFIIRPCAGSFYEVGLSVTLGSTVLVKGTDYIPICNNLQKQQNTTTSSKIYDYLKFLTPLTGTVAIAYRAYGGELYTTDITTIKSVLQSISTHLSNNTFITEQALGLTPELTNLSSRIRNLETYIRQYPMTSLLVKASDDNQLHWYKFAYLTSSVALDTAEYPLLSVPQSTDDAPVTDIGEFVIESISSKWSYHVAIQMDTRKTTNQLQVRTINNLPNTSYLDSINFTTISNTVAPKLRMVWNGDGKQTGAILELGLTLPLKAEELIRISNKSGAQGKWLLYNTVPGYSVAVDTQVTLPRNGAVWNASTPATCKSIIRTIKPEDAIVLAQGNVTLVTDSEVFIPSETLFNANAEFGSIKAVSVKVRDHVLGKDVTTVSRSMAIPSTGAYTSLDAYVHIHEELFHGVKIHITNASGTPGTVSATLTDPNTTAVAERYSLISVAILY
jgi:hypothetical protein